MILSAVIPTFEMKRKGKIKVKTVFTDLYVLKLGADPKTDNLSSLTAGRSMEQRTTVICERYLVEKRLLCKSLNLIHLISAPTSIRAPNTSLSSIILVLDATDKTSFCPLFLFTYVTKCVAQRIFWLLPPGHSFRNTSNLLLCGGIFRQGLAWRNALESASGGLSCWCLFETLFLK